jgi:hypothetical protein
MTSFHDNYRTLREKPLNFDSKLSLLFLLGIFPKIFNLWDKKKSIIILDLDNKSLLALSGISFTDDKTFRTAVCLDFPE